jgi:hypothetical protein
MISCLARQPLSVLFAPPVRMDRQIRSYPDLRQNRVPPSQACESKNPLIPGRSAPMKVNAGYVSAE